MLARHLVKPGQLLELFSEIEPELLRYPAIDPTGLRSALVAILDEVRED